MKTVMLIGTLTRDPELKERDKTKICDMRLVEAGGRREAPLYIDVSTFGRQAEVCSQYLSKGRQVAVSGQLRFREWESDGNKRSMHTIAAEHIDFLTGAGIGGKKGGRGGGKGGRSNGGGARGGRGRESRPSASSGGSGGSSGSSSGGGTGKTSS